MIPGSQKHTLEFSHLRLSLTYRNVAPNLSFNTVSGIRPSRVNTHTLCVPSTAIAGAQVPLHKKSVEPPLLIHHMDWYALTVQASELLLKTEQAGFLST